MKITKERLIEIIKEELGIVREEEVTLSSLEPLVKQALENLDIEEQTVILQYINLLKGNKQ